MADGRLAARQRCRRGWWTKELSQCYRPLPMGLRVQLSPNTSWDIWKRLLWGIEAPFSGEHFMLERDTTATKKVLARPSEHLDLVNGCSWMSTDHASNPKKSQWKSVSALLKTMSDRVIQSKNPSPSPKGEIWVIGAWIIRSIQPFSLKVEYYWVFFARRAAFGVLFYVGKFITKTPRSIYAWFLKEEIYKAWGAKKKCLGTINLLSKQKPSQAKQKALVWKNQFQLA